MRKLDAVFLLHLFTFFYYCFCMVAYWQNIFTYCEKHCNLHVYNILKREYKGGSLGKRKRVKEIRTPPPFSALVFLQLSKLDISFLLFARYKKLAFNIFIAYLNFTIFYNIICVFSFWEQSFNIRSFKLYLI